MSAGWRETAREQHGSGLLSAAITIKILRCTGCCPSDLSIYSAKGTSASHFVEQSVQAIGATVIPEMLKNKEIVVGTTGIEPVPPTMSR